MPRSRLYLSFGPPVGLRERDSHLWRKPRGRLALSTLLTPVAAHLACGAYRRPPHRLAVDPRTQRSIAALEASERTGASGGLSGAVEARTWRKIGFDPGKGPANPTENPCGEAVLRKGVDLWAG